MARTRHILSRIPAELFIVIAEYAVEAKPYWTYDSRTSNDNAYNLCCVCPVLYQTAKLVLYTNVVIPEQADPLAEKWRKFFTSDYTRAHCRKLTFKCRLPGGAWNEVRDLTRPIYPLSCLEKLPNLVCVDHACGFPERWDFPTALPPSHLWSASKECQQFFKLDTFICDRLGYWGLNVMIACLPGLKRLLVRDELVIGTGKILKNRACTSQLKEIHVFHLITSRRGLKHFLAWPKALERLSVLVVSYCRQNTSGPKGNVGLHHFVRSLHPQHQTLKLLAVPDFEHPWPVTVCPRSLYGLLALEVIFFHSPSIFELLSKVWWCTFGPRTREIILLVDGVIDAVPENTPSEEDMTAFMRKTHYAASLIHPHLSVAAATVVEELKDKLTYPTEPMKEVLFGTFRRTLKHFGIDISSINMWDMGTTFRIAMAHSLEGR